MRIAYQEIEPIYHRKGLFARTNIQQYRGLEVLLRLRTAYSQRRQAARNQKEDARATGHIGGEGGSHFDARKDRPNVERFVIRALDAGLPLDLAHELTALLTVPGDRS